jgi:hypothetical protein
VNAVVGVVLTQKLILDSSHSFHTLYRYGAPVGKMADVLKKDIAAFIRELNPLLQWESQVEDAQKRLENQIYADYHCYGEATQLGNKYLKHEVGASIRAHRFYLWKLNLRKGNPTPLRSVRSTSRNL